MDSACIQRIDPTGAQRPDGTIMRPGDSLRTNKPVRSRKTGCVLPREGIYVRSIENLGRSLILVNFGSAGEEYVFPEELASDPPARTYAQGL
jgi:hypothetical protein